MPPVKIALRESCVAMAVAALCCGLNLILTCIVLGKVYASKHNS